MARSRTATLDCVAAGRSQVSKGGSGSKSCRYAELLTAQNVPQQASSTAVRRDEIPGPA
jgi:hypothetical protein